MLTLLLKGVQTKLLKFFCLKVFFHLPLVLLTPVANLELRISPRIFGKIRNDTVPLSIYNSLPLYGKNRHQPFFMF